MGELEEEMSSSKTSAGKDVGPEERKGKRKKTQTKEIKTKVNLKKNLGGSYDFKMRE